MEIKDSGERREFETGAVRDIQVGKGRCDLMPLDVIADVYFNEFGEHDSSYKIFYNLNMFKHTGNANYLYETLGEFIADSTYSKYTGWADLFLDVSKHFEDGAKKYGENNWQKGIPVHCYIDSAIRHYLKYLRGDDDEPHDRAFIWNIMCCIWTCKNKITLNDYLEDM